MKVFANFQQKNGGDPTAEWIKARTGCITASEFKEFVGLDGTLRTGEMPKTYMAEKLFERWTGRQKPNDFFSRAVNNGVIIESQAAKYFTLEYGLEIQHVGFVSNDYSTVGASPDGLIGFGKLRADVPSDMPQPPDGASGLEIKAPELYTHIKWLMDGGLPKDHICQVQGSMFLTGCKTWHFVSYPLASHLDGFPWLHLEIERDDEWQENFAESVSDFLLKFDEEWDKLVDRNGGPPVRAVTPDELRSKAEQQSSEMVDYKV